jgi:hypothetical protein
MKQYKKAAAVLGVLLFIASPSFGQMPDIGAIEGYLDDLSKDFASGLAFNSSLGLWSDAYIGKLIDTPPHFGVGIDAGATTVKSKALKGLLGELGEADSAITDLVDGLGLPIPGALLSARIGGFVLPFDIGLKGMYLPSISLGEISFDYAVFGVDFRYALLQDKGPLPGLSVGLGYTYMGGGVGLAIGSDQTIDFSGTKVNFTKPELNIAWGSSTLDLKVQVSKKLLIFTPFLGVGASYAFSDIDFSISTESDIPQSIKDIAKQYGFDLGSQEITSTLSASSFIFRIYGGTSFDLAVIRLNLGFLYNPIGNGLGGDFGIRFQL